MKEELRGLQRRIADLRALADRMELAERNLVTLSSLKDWIRREVLTLRERAIYLHEAAEDLLDDGKVNKLSKKKRK